MKNILFNEEISINLYLKDVRNTKVLSLNEEKELIRKIKEGDNAAKNEFINSNLRFVIHIAKQYQNRGVLLLDLINEGNLGLIHAIETFDESKNVRFVSYAVYWIKQAILSALTKYSHTIYIPFNQYYLFNKIKKIINGKHEEDYTSLEEKISKNLKIDKEEVKKIISELNILNPTISLDTSLSSSDKEDKESTLIDVIKNEDSKSPDSELIELSMKKDLNKILNKVLDEKEKKVIFLNYGLEDSKPMSLQEISDLFGVTKECIRQIKEKAMRKLRLYDGNKILRQYL